MVKKLYWLDINVQVIFFAKTALDSYYFHAYTGVQKKQFSTSVLKVIWSHRVPIVLILFFLVTGIKTKITT